MKDIYNSFPDSIRTLGSLRDGNSFIELIRYPIGDSIRWEGYYRQQRLSLFNNGYFWIVEAFWRGEVRGYFRHYKDQLELGDVKQLVIAACSLIDIFSENE